MADEGSSGTDKKEDRQKTESDKKTYVALKQGMKDAGKAVAKPVIKLTTGAAGAAAKVVKGAPAFLILAILMHIIDGAATNWTWGVNSLTVGLDILLFIIAVFIFGKERFVFIAGIFLMEVLTPYLGQTFPVLLDVNIVSLLFVKMLWPWWAIFDGYYALQEKGGKTIGAIFYIGLIVFWIFFLGLPGELSQFYAESITTPQQKEQIAQGWENIGDTFSSIQSNLHCSLLTLADIFTFNSDIIESGSGAQCFDKLKKKVTVVGTCDQVKIDFAEYKKDGRKQTMFDNQEKYSIKQILKVKNDVYDGMRLQLECGIGMVDDKFVIPGVAQIPRNGNKDYLLLKKGDNFEEKVVCLINGKPKKDETEVFFRATMSGLSTDVQLKRLFVSTINPDRATLYDQVRSQTFTQPGFYGATSKGGLLKLDVDIDSDHGLVERAIGESVSLGADIVLPCEGEITFEALSIDYDSKYFNVIECESEYVKASGQSITYSSDYLKGYGTMEKDDFISLPACTLQVAEQKGQQDIPTVHEFYGRIMYHYELVEDFDFIVKEGNSASS